MKKYLIIFIELIMICTLRVNAMANELLTEPILAIPTYTSVTVEWYTESEGADNKVLLYENGVHNGVTREIKASTYKLSRIRGGITEATCNDATKKRDVYKHRAVVRDIPEYTGKSNQRVPYRVISDDANSKVYTLTAKPQQGSDIKLLLTSDLQIKNMCAANMQKVEETVGMVDAVIINGDCVDVTDRAYDWFYSDNAFYKVLQGTASHKVNSVKYTGGELIQYAPMYTSIGNHDVMGVYSDSQDLSVQFNNPKPREYARELLDKKKAAGNGPENEADFIENQSYNTITYEEMFDLPRSQAGGKKYYATTIGDVRLIVLDASRVWRLPQLGVNGKYSEIPGASRDQYGFGDFIFEDIDGDSDQIKFLEAEVKKPEFINAKYKMVMFHFQYHSLGGNQIPAFTNPVASTVKDPVTGKDMVIYDYPIDDDYIDKYVAPILEDSGVDFVYTAHSHVWNRFMTESGMNILESSNVGNTYNCYLGDDKRTDYPSALKKGDRYSTIADKFSANNYVLSGDPYGLTPVTPSEGLLPDNKPYLASNTITAFSVLDTGKGTIDSYYFDTARPDSEVVLFDSFDIKRQ